MNQEKIHVIDHPMVQHKLCLLRDKDTGVKEFRECMSEITGLLSYEATRDLPMKEMEIETPMGRSRGWTIEGKTLALVPVLRAGLAMLDGILQLIPAAKVGHLGLYRDPATLQSVQYYCKMPSDINEREVIILDPMLATGASAVEAVQILKNYKCRSIKVMCIIASTKGVDRLQKSHPDVDIYCAAIDDRVDEKGYIIPGLGDAGNRVYGTK